MEDFVLMCSIGFISCLAPTDKRNQNKNWRWRTLFWCALMVLFSVWFLSCDCYRKNRCHVWHVGCSQPLWLCSSGSMQSTHSFHAWCKKNKKIKMDVCSMGSLGHSPLFCAASPCYPSLSNQGLKIECNIKIKEAFSHRMLYFTVFKVLFVEMYVAVVFVTSCLYSWF